MGFCIRSSRGLLVSTMAVLYVLAVEVCISHLFITKPLALQYLIFKTGVILIHSHSHLFYILEMTPVINEVTWIIIVLTTFILFRCLYQGVSWTKANGSGSGVHKEINFSTIKLRHIWAVTEELLWWIFNNIQFTLIKRVITYAFKIIRRQYAINKSKYWNIILFEFQFPKFR